MSEASMKTSGASEASPASESGSPTTPTLGLFRQFADRARGVAPMLTPVLPSRFESALPASRSEMDPGLAEAPGNSLETRDAMARRENTAMRLWPNSQSKQDSAAPHQEPSAQSEEITHETRGVRSGESPSEGAKDPPRAPFRDGASLASRFTSQSPEAMLPRTGIETSREATSAPERRATRSGEERSPGSGENLANPSPAHLATSAQAKAGAAPWELPSSVRDRNSEKTMPAVDSLDEKQWEQGEGQFLRPASPSANLAANLPAQPAVAPWAQTRVSPNLASNPGSKNKSTALAGVIPEATMAQRLGLSSMARPVSEGQPSRNQSNTPVTQTAAAPQVHIRIGRVDFRSVPSAAPARPAPARPTGPAMDLEGYLRSLDRRTR